MSFGFPLRQRVRAKDLNGIHIKRINDRLSNAATSLQSGAVKTTSLNIIALSQIYEFNHWAIVCLQI